MRFPRTLAFVALAASPVLSLTSCGGDAEGAKTTLGTVQTTSYVVEEPVTTTSTTTLPSATPEGQVDPNEQIHVVVTGNDREAERGGGRQAPDSHRHYRNLRGQ